MIPVDNPLMTRASYRDHETASSQGLRVPRGACRERPRSYGERHEAKRRVISPRTHGPVAARQRMRAKVTAIPEEQADTVA